GSHGSGYFTQYRNVRAVDVYMGVLLRGSGEVTKGVYGAGRIQYLVQAEHGDCTDVDGLYFSDGVPDWVSHAKYQYSYSTGKLFSGVRLVLGKLIKTRPVTVSNVHLQGVKDSVIQLSGTGSVGPITLSGAINVITDNEEADTSEFHLIRAGTPGGPTMTGPVRISRSTILNKPNSPKTRVTEMSVTNFIWSTGSYLRDGNGSVRVTLADDAVLTLPIVPKNAMRVSLYCSARYTSSWQITDALVW